MISESQAPIRGIAIMASGLFLHLK